MDKAIHGGVLYLRFDDELAEIGKSIHSSSEVIVEELYFLLSRVSGSYH